jgi:hypothetical protein
MSAKKLLICFGVLALLVLALVDFSPTAKGLSSAEVENFTWKEGVGALLVLSWFVFIGTSIACTFFIDRRKVAEAEYWIPVGYTFPPRRYLTPQGQGFAVARFCSMVASFVLLLLVLAIVP